MKVLGIDVLFVYSDEYHPGYSFYFTNFRTINCIEEIAHELFIPLEGQIQAFIIKEHLERLIQYIFGQFQKKKFETGVDAMTV